MKIETIDCFLINLPFRFSFGHSLASRNESTNIIVKVVMSDGQMRCEGYGEGVPRDYVTGETPEQAVIDVADLFMPRFIEKTFKSGAELVDSLRREWNALHLANQPKGAAWCAFELAMLDAAAKIEKRSLFELLNLPSKVEKVQYGGVIPFGGNKAFKAVLYFYRMFGFRTVKIKVGHDLDYDLNRIKIARAILGDSVKIRVDANCAWSPSQAIEAARQMRPFGVLSYEQPLPAADLSGMAEVTANIPEQVLADESLCTVDDARKLAELKACSAFNIRISKLGGLLASSQVVQIAERSNIVCHMGAQVGESGILSAAGRVFACMHNYFENYEGSNNLFLLKKDITAENLNVSPGGWGHRLHGDGLGVTVLPQRLVRCSAAPSSANATQIERMRRIGV